MNKILSAGYSNSLLHQARLRATTLLTLFAFLFALSGTDVQAKPKVKANSLNIVPIIKSIEVENGQLVASGVAKAVINGQTYTTKFKNVPVNVSAVPGQIAACPVLDLTLGPIDLNLLGLVVETSPICLTITAYDGGGLLGDLLCSIANLLNQGIPLSQILAGLTSADLNLLTTGLTDLLNAALGSLLDAIVGAISPGSGGSCDILNLALGPVDLTLLGLNVHLDDCADGPVTVDITGQEGLLGELLCGLLGGGAINLGDTLQDIINTLLGALN